MNNKKNDHSNYRDEVVNSLDKLTVAQPIYLEVFKLIDKKWIAHKMPGLSVAKIKYMAKLLRQSIIGDDVVRTHSVGEGMDVVVELDGYVVDGAALRVIKESLFANELLSCRVFIEDGRSLNGMFVIAQYEMTIGANELRRLKITLCSGGVIKIIDG